MTGGQPQRVQQHCRELLQDARHRHRHDGTARGDTGIAERGSLAGWLGIDHVNSGTIIATASVSNTTQAQVEIEQGQTLMALYTVPAGQTAYMHRFYYSINKKTAISANLRLFVKPFGGAWNLKSLLGAGSTGDNSDDRDFKIPMPIAEKTDIRMTAIANVTGGDISAGYDIVLVEN